MRNTNARRDVAVTYMRWTWMRAVFHRGWWLATSLYLVVVADLSASQLVFYGAVLAFTMLVAEIVRQARPEPRYHRPPRT